MARPKYGTAEHEVGTYKTDCDCKGRYHRRFREGMEHLRTCGKATALYFCEHYGEPRIVATKAGGQVV